MKYLFGMMAVVLGGCAASNAVLEHGNGHERNVTNTMPAAIAPTPPKAIPPSHEKTHHDHTNHHHD